MSRPILPVAITLFALLTSAAADEPAPGESELRLARAFLTSPEIAGQDAALDAAARYLAVELKRLGYSPAGADGAWFLPMTRERRSPGRTSLVAVRYADGARVLAPGAEFAPFPFSKEGEIAGEVVFVPYGREGDYEGVDVAGRVVFSVHGAPDGAPPVESIADLHRIAAGRGAAGLVIAPDPRRLTLDEVRTVDGRTFTGRVEDRGTAFLLTPLGPGETRLFEKDEVAEIRFALPPGPLAAFRSKTPERTDAEGPVAVSISAHAAGLVLGGAFDAMLSAVDAIAPPRARHLPSVTLRLRVAFERESQRTLVVAGRRGGADPRLRRQDVIVTASYEPADAATIATLGAARILAQGDETARSLLFLFRLGGEGGVRYVADRRELAGERAAGWIAASAGGEVAGLRVGPGKLPELLEAMVRDASQGLATAVRGDDRPGAGMESLATRPGFVSIRMGDEGMGVVLDGARLIARIARARAGAVKPPTPGEGERPPAETAPAVAALPETLAAAREARLTGRPAPALVAIEGVLRESPGDPRLYLERGRIRIALLQTADALDDATNLDRIDPTSGAGDLLRSEAFTMSREPEAAKQAFGRAVAARHPEALFRRGVQRIDAASDGAADGSRVAGVADLREASRAAAGTAIGHLARGVALLNSSPPDIIRIRVEIDRAIDMDPLLADAYRFRSELRVALNEETRAALADCEEAIRLGSTHPGLLFNRGLCRLKLSLFTLSIRDFKACAAKDHAVATSYYNIACAYALMDSREEALLWLARCASAGFFTGANRARNIPHARSDPDLTSIRSDPRFEATLRARYTD